MDMTIQEEIEQLVLRCIAADGLKACPKDISFLEKYRLKNLYFLSVRYRMEGTDCPELDRRAEGLIRWNIYSTDFPLLRRVYAREGKEALMRCLYLEEGYFRRFLERLHIISSLSTPNIAILSGTLMLLTLQISVMRLP